MTDHNETPLETAFTVSIEAREGVSTGISAADRARTIQVAIDPGSTAHDLVHPGHVFPLRARPGGVLQRAGQTESAVDLARLAGLNPAGVVCEIMNEDGTMARVPDLTAFSERHGLKMITVADLIEYRRRTEKLVERVVSVRLPTEHGEFQAIAYRERLDDGKRHVALVKGEVEGVENVLVRVHSECLTGDVFHSQLCDCGEQLAQSLARIEAEGRGVLLYMAQEGRGIGLLNKLRAYELQQQGLDTVEANLELGFPPDAREWGIGNQILADLGLTTIRILTNNPAKLSGLDGFGLTVVEQVPIEVDPQPENERYLAAKREKLGHTITKLHHQGVRFEPEPRPNETTNEQSRHRRLERERALGLAERGPPPEEDLDEAAAEPFDHAAEVEDVEEAEDDAPAWGTSADVEPSPRPRRSPSSSRGRPGPRRTGAGTRGGGSDGRAGAVRGRRRAFAVPSLVRARRRRPRHPRGLRRARGRRRRRPESGRCRRRPLQRRRDVAPPLARARGARADGSPARGDHGHGRPGRVRAAGRRDRAREDAPFRLHRRARLRHPRRHAALRLRRERGRERAPARRAGDGRAGLLRGLTLDRVEQAEPRIEKAGEAVRSALEMADVFSHLRAAAAAVAEGEATPRPYDHRTAAPIGTMLGRMSKVCAICGKKPGFGNSRSHSMVATKRRFNPNLQRVRVLLEGRAERAYVCTRCLKAGEVRKAV